MNYHAWEAHTLEVSGETSVSITFSASSRVFHQSLLWTCCDGEEYRHITFAPVLQRVCVDPALRSPFLSPALMRYQGLRPGVSVLFFLPSSPCHVSPWREWHWNGEHLGGHAFSQGVILQQQKAFFLHTKHRYTHWTICGALMGWEGKHEGGSLEKVDNWNGPRLSGN